MNREIKFRVRKATGEWAYFGLDDLIRHASNVPSWVYEYPSLKKDQYTGLNDKNGKEIYEGDIVKHPVLGYENSNVGEVRYVNAAFLVVNDDWEEITYSGERRKTFTLSSVEKYEVIGNIYQNPVLLGKTRASSQN
jgi:uncharacterized phage protein (TIGR01671 family)